MGLIYLATNTINGKVYIGQTTKSLEERRKGHRGSKYARSVTHLTKAFQKYGFETFSWKVLEDELKDSELDLRERYYIQLYESMNPNKGYNHESGGNLHKRLSEATRKQISLTQKGKRLSKETCERMSKTRMGHPGYNKGKSPSEETRKRMSDSQRGKSRTPEWRAKIGAANRGKKRLSPISEETRQKLREATRRRWKLTREQSEEKI